MSINNLNLLQPETEIVFNSDFIRKGSSSKDMYCDKENADPARFIDYKRPAGGEKELKSILKRLNIGSSTQLLAKYTQLSEKADVLRTVIDKIREFEEVDGQDKVELSDVLQEVFSKSVEYDDMLSVINYSMKLLKCSEPNQLIKRIKQLNKRKSSATREAVIDKQAYVKEKIKFRDIETWIEKLRVASGLDKKYDHLLVLK